MATETPGDGSMLTPMRARQALYRSLLGIEHEGVRYDVDLNFFDLDETVLLYRNGIQDRVQTGTARFALPDGARIEVALSTYGLRRAHLVLADGRERPLEPARGTGERWRADLEHDRPGLSRTLGIVSWSILVIALVLQLPQLAQLGAELTGWYEFTSPVTLPAWMNTPLTVAGVLAGTERALRMRYHWLLD